MEKIDFVITWVDGNDPKWQEEKNRYTSDGDSRTRRYRDWGTLKYLLRSIEENAPFVNKVFLLTYGHLPEWLNTDNPKLVIVNHEDFIPSEYLPTFSSRTIDLNFHRIPELSEHFVYFNDDMIILNKTAEIDYFRNGLPRTSAILKPYSFIVKDKDGTTMTSDNFRLSRGVGIGILNKHFIKRESVQKHPFKWYNLTMGKRALLYNLCMMKWSYFSDIEIGHVPYSYLKSTYQKVWEKEGKVLDEICQHKFRVNVDPNHYLMSYWQIAEGNFEPRNPSFGKEYSIVNGDNSALLKTIKKKAMKVICLNDDYDGDDYEKTRDEILKELETQFGKKSPYER